MEKLVGNFPTTLHFKECPGLPLNCDQTGRHFLQLRAWSAPILNSTIEKWPSYGQHLAPTEVVYSDFGPETQKGWWPLMPMRFALVIRMFLHLSQEKQVYEKGEQTRTASLPKMNLQLPSFFPCLLFKELLERDQRQSNVSNLLRCSRDVFPCITWTSLLAETKGKTNFLFVVALLSQNIWVPMARRASEFQRYRMYYMALYPRRNSSLTLLHAYRKMQP